MRDNLQVDCSQHHPEPKEQEGHPQGDRSLCPLHVPAWRQLSVGMEKERILSEARSQPSVMVTGYQGDSDRKPTMGGADEGTK